MAKATVHHVKVATKHSAIKRGAVKIVKHTVAPANVGAALKIYQRTANQFQRDKAYVASVKIQHPVHAIHLTD